MSNPIESVASIFQGPKANGHPLTYQQAKALIDATKERKALRAMLSLALNLGLGMPEVLKIEAKDIDFKQAAIKLTMPPRTLLAPEKTLRALSEAIDQKHDQDAKLFNYSDRTIETKITELGTGTLGFPITWSSLRKTWVKLCVERNVAITSMVRYSGASIDSLAKWAIIYQNEKEERKELPIELF